MFRSFCRNFLLFLVVFHKIDIICGLHLTCDIRQKIETPKLIGNWERCFLCVLPKQPKRIGIPPVQVGFRVCFSENRGERGDVDAKLCNWISNLVEVKKAPKFDRPLSYGVAAYSQTNGPVEIANGRKRNSAATTFSTSFSPGQSKKEKRPEQVHEVLGVQK